jgi:hypothetical protein
LGETRDRERGRFTCFDLVERTGSLMFGLKGVPVTAGSGGAEKETGEKPSGTETVGVAGTDADAS